MKAQTLLDVFVPPEGMVGHSAALVAMTGAEDFLEDAVQRFTGLRPRQRAELGVVLAYLMLDGHSSPSRQAVFPPGRVPGLHEFQPRSSGPGSLLHAKVALLAFASSRTGVPEHLRLAILTANFGYASARRQLELVWVVDVPILGPSRAEDRADVWAAGNFMETLLQRRFHRDKHSLPARDRKLTSRLDDLLGAAASLRTNRRPRFIHSLDRPLYDQIRERLGRAIDKPRNFLLCGSGFYEEPFGRAAKPAVLGKLEDLGVFTPKPYRVAIVEPREAGAIADWARAGTTDGWNVVRPVDALGQDRQLHAKFVYVGYLRDGHASNGWLYLGSGNLSRRGLLTHGGLPEGNVETGIVVEVANRLAPDDLEQSFFWAQDQDEIEQDQWAVGQVGDAPGDELMLEASPILSAAIEAKLARSLRLYWREDADNSDVWISWTGRDWFEVQPAKDVPLLDGESPSALHVRDHNNHTWIVPVVDATGRIGWQPPRFESYADALAALLDFPIRPAEATDDDEREDGLGSEISPRVGGGADEQEKSYALHAAAELVERVAALQVALPESMLDDWLDHLDRMLAASFPESLITAWRAHHIDIFAHLREPEMRSPHLSAGQRARYFALLDRAAYAWGVR